MELATEAGLTVQEEPLNRYDIYTADEGFFLSLRTFLAPLLPVTRGSLRPAPSPRGVPSAPQALFPARDRRP